MHNNAVAASDEELPEEIKKELRQYTTNERSELGRAISEWIDGFAGVTQVYDVIKGRVSRQVATGCA